jgi:hypothetical protein
MDSGDGYPDTPLEGDMKRGHSSKSRFGWAVLAVLWLSFAGRKAAAQCGDPNDLRFEFKAVSTPEYVRPGDEFQIVFSVSGTREIEGFRFFLDYNEEEADFVAFEQLYRRPDGESFAVQSVEVNAESNFPNGERPHSGSETLEEGFVRGEILFGAPSFDIPSGAETPVYEFRFRVRPGIRVTDVTVGFKDDYRPEGVTYQNMVTFCGAESREDLDWSSFGPQVLQEGECLPGNSLELTYALEDAVSAPGSDVTVPFFVEANDRLDGFSVSVDFDEEVLEGTSFDMAYRTEDGSPWAFERVHLDNSNDVPGNGGVDEGFFVAHVVFDFRSTAHGIPRGERTRIADLQFRVREGVSTDSTEIRFLDGGVAPGTAPAVNNAAICGSSVVPEDVHAFVFTNGVIGIIDEITIFRRGDSNGDDRVDVSDAVHTLSYLFWGGDRPACYDAADANDDGTIDISDAITTLDHLFSGSGSLAPPGDAPGEDLTPDPLRCVGRSG